MVDTPDLVSQLLARTRRPAPKTPSQADVELDRAAAVELARLHDLLSEVAAATHRDRDDGTVEVVVAVGTWAALRREFGPGPHR